MAGNGFWALGDWMRNLQNGQKITDPNNLGTVAPTATRPTYGTTIGTGDNQIDIAEQVGKQLKAKPISYTPKTLDSYMPGSVKNAMDANLGKITNFNAQPVQLSSDYWNKTLQDTLEPMKKAQDLAREQMRGDLAAEGNIYDSEGHESVRKQADDYLTQIGAVTRGVQIAREKQAADDAKWAQEQNLAAATTGAGTAGNYAQLYGDVGSNESQFATTAELQDKAAKNSLLGGTMDWLTGKYNAETDAYTADRQADVDTYKAEQDAADALRQRWIDYLNLPGYGDVEGSDDTMVNVGSALMGGSMPKQAASVSGSSGGITANSNRARELGLIGGMMDSGKTVRGNDGRYYRYQPGTSIMEAGSWVLI